MPIKKEREYRALAAPLTAQSATKLIQTEYYVEGYATTFDAPYLLYEFEDGTKIYERIDAHALDGADMSDVIMQYDHEGRVFARQSNKTLILQPDYKGLKVAADLGKTDLARGLYQDIEAEAGNLYSEYMVIDGKLEKVGDWKVDLSSYAKTTEVTAAIANALTAYAKTADVTKAINAANLKFKADFDLGDRITCKETKWGIQIDARITEVTETYQKGEETIEATFGDSLPTLVDQIRKVR